MRPTVIGASDSSPETTRRTPETKETRLLEYEARGSFPDPRGGGVAGGDMCKKHGYLTPPRGSQNLSLFPRLEASFPAV